MTNLLLLTSPDARLTPLFHMASCSSLYGVRDVYRYKFRRIYIGLSSSFINELKAAEWSSSETFRTRYLGGVPAQSYLAATTGFASSAGTYSFNVRVADLCPLLLLCSAILIQIGQELFVFNQCLL